MEVGSKTEHTFSGWNEEVSPIGKRGPGFLVLVRCRDPLNLHVTMLTIKINNYLIKRSLVI
jgi:hypothetical protein